MLTLSSGGGPGAILRPPGIHVAEHPGGGWGSRLVCQFSDAGVVRGSWFPAGFDLLAFPRQRRADSSR